jgi:Kef-type K+ transport system membrane component KefB
MTRVLVASVLLVLFLPAPALAAGNDPSLPLLGFLVVILLAAKLMGSLAIRLGQPAVLGELLAGVVLGNVALAGVTGLEGLATDPSIDMLARLGVLVLLFEVGLESTVRDMMKVGLSSLLVALLGVAAPMALGWGVGAWLLPDHSVYVHVFLGATLTATSVGITARVLKDLNRSTGKEARIILGAAVIDDVLGLVVLAVVTGIIAAADRGETVGLGSQAWILGKAGLFLGGALAIGSFLSPRVFRLAYRLRGGGILLSLALTFCFLLSLLAGVAGLAPIVGAFAAGLVLEPVHYRKLAVREAHQLEDLLHPLAAFLVPVFFVQMGARVDLRTFASTDALLLAGALTIAAVVGKQACSLGVIDRGVDRLTVGLGMIPRGEVGLIFASIGLGLHVAGEPIIDTITYSAVVIMVIVTTMVAPPLIGWGFRRVDRKDVTT